MKTNKPSKGGDEKVSKTLRKDKRNNQMKIRDELLRCLEEECRIPEYSEFKEVTGLSRQTINKHLKEIDFEGDKEFYKVFTPEVMNNIRILTKTSPAAQKLWLQLFEGFSERLEHTGKDGEKLFPDKINIVVKK